MTPPSLQQSLGLIRRRLRRVLAAFGLGRVLAVASAGMGGIYAVDRLLAPPGLVRWGLGIFVAMVIFRVAWKKLVLPLSASLPPSHSSFPHPTFPLIPFKIKTTFKMFDFLT